MRIVFVTPEYVTESNYDGGLANFINKAAISLVGKGHDVIVITISTKNDVFFNDKIKVVRVKRPDPFSNRLDGLLRNLLNGPFMWLRMSFKLNHVLRREMQIHQIDIVQYASYTAPGFFRIKKLKSVVRISSLQDLWSAAYNEKSTLSRKIKNFLELSALRKADAIYGPSKLIGDIVSDRLGGKEVELIEGPIKHIQGLDYELYNSTLVGKQYFLFFGSLGLLKGVKEIADMLNDLLFKYPNIHFVFIGKDLGFNGEPMANYINRQANSFRERVLFLGVQRHDLLIPIILNSVAVVLPSRVDNLPNTCTESMLLRKVVIGTRGASFDQLIQDGVNGFLCEKENSKSLLQTLERVLALSPDEKIIVCDEANKRMENLSPDQFTKNLERFFIKNIERRN